MNASLLRTTASQWKWALSVWIAFGAIDALDDVFVMHAEGMHHHWILLFFIVMCEWIPWALATPFVLNLARAIPARPVGWAVHVGFCVAIDAVASAWTALLDLRFNPYANPTPPAFTHYLTVRFYEELLASIILYGLLLVLSAALESRRRLAAQQTETARLNEQLSRAQLDALRLQIEPHFLFNTLNSISGLVRENRNDAAVSMIAGLSDLLRRSLEDAPHQQVPLGEEMAFAQKYLDIQKMRFADRLQISMDIPAELHTAQVPSLILQPMVENAIKHGIAHRAQGGAIHITAAREDSTLTLRIANDGPSLAANWETARSGIGIANVRSRLESLYGPISTLTLRNQPTGGVEVTLSLPYTLVPNGAQ